jgi:CRISPR-associated endonuclease Cas2
MKSYLGMYDVSSPKLRSAIFKLLSAYGIHQQKSVFECQLNFDLKNNY